MNFRDMKTVLDKEFRKLSKRDFIEVVSSLDPKSRVGGPRGKGRLTAKKALSLLGIGR